MNTLREYWRELVRRSPLLAWAGALHFLLLGVAGVLFFIDTTVVMGINAWIKPMKFMVSIAVYLWTVAWLVGYLRGPRWALRIITGGITLSMVIETVCLFIQAGRGTTSHYNVATAFDGQIFGLMGTMIAVDTVLMIGLLLLFLRKDVDLPGPYLWGIRLGILVFLVGGWVGGQMIANMAHTVGAPDGGPGLPFLNWSVEAGDLRIAHALGLHALQLLPLVGFGLSRRIHGDGPRGTSTGAVIVMAALYLAVLLGMFSQAKAGVPLIAL